MTDYCKLYRKFFMLIGSYKNKRKFASILETIALIYLCILSNAVILIWFLLNDIQSYLNIY